MNSPLNHSGETEFNYCINPKPQGCKLKLVFDIKFRDLFWGSQAKSCLVAWDKTCTRKKLGGLGV